MLTISKVTKEQIKECNFDIDPHTVRLTDDGEWFALKKDGRIVSVLCIRIQRNELYIGEVFTEKQSRGNGFFTLLCDYVVNTIYSGYSISTHALAASKKAFERCGFEQFSYREFKYGNQWWLRRKGKKIC